MKPKTLDTYCKGNVVTPYGNVAHLSQYYNET